MMACARSATRSLAKMLETWLRTVFWLRRSLRAISGFVSCLAMSARISCSRSVSSGKASGGALGRGPANYYCMRRLAIEGPKMASPLTTARIERRISAFRAPLSR